MQTGRNGAHVAHAAEAAAAPNDVVDGLRLELERQRYLITVLQSQIDRLNGQADLLAATSRSPELVRWPHWPAAARAIEVAAIVAGVAAGLWTIDATRQQLLYTADQNRKLQAQIDLQKEQDYIARRTELYSTLYDRKESCSESEKDSRHRCAVKADIRAREQALKALLHIERGRRQPDLSLDGLDMRGGFGGRRANLAGFDLVHARLEHADLSGASLVGADLEGAQLAHAALDYVDLTGANLRDAGLFQADLTSALLRGAELSYARMNGSRMAHADLSDANLADAELFGATLDSANLSDVHAERVDMTNASLEHASLRDAVLRHANLQGARLSDADCTGAQLEGAYLARAELEHVQWADARLAGSVFFAGTLLRNDISHADTPEQLRRVLGGADTMAAHFNCEGVVGANYNGTALDGAPCGTSAR